MSEDVPDMERFNRKGPKQTHTPVVRAETNYNGTVKTIRFNAQARREWMDEKKYVNFYVADGYDMVGVKPIEGSGADGNSYKISAGTVSFTTVGRETGITVPGDCEIDAHWDDDEEMIILDFSSVSDA